jgi:hypothetical protein
MRAPTASDYQRCKTVAVPKHRHLSDEERRISETFIGQAHIAGTGPAEKTCRECAFFGVVTDFLAIDPPGYEGIAAFPEQMRMRSARCHKGLSGQAARNIPPIAKACVYFEQRSPVPPLVISRGEVSG